MALPVYAQTSLQSKGAGRLGPGAGLGSGISHLESEVPVSMDGVMLQTSQGNNTTLLQAGKGVGAHVGVEDWDFHWVPGMAQCDQWLALSSISY